MANEAAGEAADEVFGEAADQAADRPTKPPKQQNLEGWFQVVLIDGIDEIVGCNRMPAPQRFQRSAGIQPGTAITKVAPNPPPPPHYA